MPVERFTYPRFPDWPSRWAEFIHDCQQLQPDLAIDWEYINCLQFAFMGVEVLTGHDPYEAFNQDVVSPTTAIRAIKKWGYNTLDEGLADMFPEVPLAFAQPGDIVLVNPVDWSNDHLLTQVVPHAVALADPPFYYAPGLGGLGRGSMYKEALRAFAVGYEPKGGSI